MVMALMVALLSGQAVYEWIDAKGQSHFTNDPGSIPAGAKRRSTTGEALTVTPATPKVDAGVVVAPVAAARDTCAPARLRVALLEKQLEDSKTVTAESTRCQEVLMLRGQGAFAQCMASRSQAGVPGENLQSELENSRDVLRKAQLSGCR